MQVSDTILCDLWPGMVDIGMFIILGKQRQQWGQLQLHFSDFSETSVGDGLNLYKVKQNGKLTAKL